MTKLALGLAIVLVLPPAAGAQGVTWMAIPAVMADSEFGGGDRYGPGLVLGAEIRSHRSAAFGLNLSVARTDFDVLEDQLHRNYGAAEVSLRIGSNNESASFRVVSGLGVVWWDDVSETDPDFRSGSDVEEVIVLGVATRLSLGERWGLTAFARDHLTGWYSALADPQEGRIGHRIMMGVGVYLR